MHSQQFSASSKKSADKLHEILAERQLQQKRDLRRAAALLELHKHKGIPYDLAREGFVFSKDQVQAFAERMIRLNESHHIERAFPHAAARLCGCAA
jgi:hypothetical protein